MRWTPRDISGLTAKTNCQQNTEGSTISAVGGGCGGGLGEQAEGGEVLGPDAEAGPEVVVPLLAVVLHPDHREQEVLRVRAGALRKDPPGGGGLPRRRLTGEGGPVDPVTPQSRSWASLGRDRRTAPG